MSFSPVFFFYSFDFADLVFLDRDFIEGKWDALDPETLPGSDSD